MIKLLSLGLVLLLAAAPALAESADSKQIRAEFEATYEQIVSSGPNFSFTGLLTKGRNSTFAINGEDFEQSSETLVVGSPKVGAMAEVRGRVISGKNIASALVVHEATKETAKSAGPEM